MNADTKNSPDALDPQACWSVVERVASLPSFKRAVRLREFLLYVAAKSLKESRTNIHEQEIGETVFSRQHSYDTSQDNIVRVSATELRKRVDAYFAAEGRDEPLVFEIPRGSYLPLFRLRNAAATPSSAPADAIAEPSAATPPAPSGMTPALWIVSVLVLLLAIACLLLWRQNETLRQHIQFLEHEHLATAGAKPELLYPDSSRRDPQEAATLYKNQQASPTLVSLQPASRPRLSAVRPNRIQIRSHHLARQAPAL